MPAHAQRINCLLASDKEDAPCKSKGGHMMRGEVRAGRREDMGRRQRTSGMHGERVRLRMLGGL